MGVRVRCPNPACRQLFYVEESRLGRKGGCSVCGQVFPLQGEETTQTQESSSTPSEKTAPPFSSQNQPTKVGRFQIRELLGTGAFGAVYRAYDPKLDREVALKVPQADVLEKKQLERFLREARAAAR
jgi:serine/threonine protein kinase